MMKLSEYLGNYINDKGEKIYYYHPTIVDSSYLMPRVDNTAELDDVEILEIHGAMTYLTSPEWEAGIETKFPNLKKLIIHPSYEEGYETLALGDGAFNHCTKLKEIHLYRNICFVNKRGNLHWNIPFKDSKEAVFYYHTMCYPCSIIDSMGEIKRWNITYEEIRNQSDMIPKELPYM